jgi:thymidylate kinase
MFRRSHTELSKVLGENNPLLKLLVRFRSIFLATHYLSVGKDREKRYRLAKKQAKEGAIVIFDRFPFFSPLDGAEIDKILGENQGWVVRKLAELERKLYESFDYLDLLIILDVDPAESIKRKPDHAYETIQYKYEALTRLNHYLDGNERGFQRVEVNANLPFDDVLLETKRKVWAQI